MEIDKDYIKGKLPNVQGNVQKNYYFKCKPFVQNDIKTLMISFGPMFYLVKKIAKYGQLKTCIILLW